MAFRQYIPFASGCNTTVCVGYYYTTGLETSRVNLFATFTAVVDGSTLATGSTYTVKIADFDGGTCLLQV